MEPDTPLCGARAVSAPPFGDGGTARHGGDDPFPAALGGRPASTRAPGVHRSTVDLRAAPRTPSVSDGARHADMAGGGGDLDTCRRALGRAAQGQGAAVAVRGEAGLGKSTLLAAHDGRDDTGALIRAAAEAATAASRPFARGRLALDHGTWPKRQRETAAAQSQLRYAYDLFTRLGAIPWQESARAELRADRPDGRPRAVPPGDRGPAGHLATDAGFPSVQGVSTAGHRLPTGTRPRVAGTR
ncbi:hypothetical protein GCM10010300_81590 [Streptomyces olivaceoviridis]|nr:hypothetical protein GCM10010300_81590 [Streptomyces olivaceoviridis]